MANVEDLITAVIVALAKTWDSKLPGFAEEFCTHMDHIRLMTPMKDFDQKDAIEKLTNGIRSPYGNL
jgi:hypothetical protein